jgi:hypothetical protein
LLRPNATCCPDGYVTVTVATPPVGLYCSATFASTTLDQPAPNAAATRGSRLL